MSSSGAPVSSSTLCGVRSRCVCGALSLEIANLTLLENAPAVDCHCPNCRRYHVAAFASYVKVPTTSVTWSDESKQARYPDICQPQHETVLDEDENSIERIACSKCHTKLATVSLKAENEEIWVNLGPIEDKTVPSHILRYWQTNRQQRHLESSSNWMQALPKFPRTQMPQRQRQQPTGTPTELTGGCTCGACRYRITNFQTPTELQHCYCRLCRQYSGSAFQTWFPAESHKLEWSNEPGLVRTTPHGRRHICKLCGGVLTIVYDSQQGYIWPAAGSLDDDELPPTVARVSAMLGRVVHICCIWKQDWYNLPEDGLDRVGYAC